MQKIAWETSLGRHERYASLTPRTNGIPRTIRNGARSMDTGSKDKILSGDGSRLATAEQRLKELGIQLPTPPEPFGVYAEAVQTGNLLFLTGMLPTVGREAKFIGRIGAELDTEAG